MNLFNAILIGLCNILPTAMKTKAYQGFFEEGRGTEPTGLPQCNYEIIITLSFSHKILKILRVMFKIFQNHIHEVGGLAPETWEIFENFLWIHDSDSF